MKAIGFTRSLPSTDPQSLVDFTTATPVATGRDLLIAVRAVSVNPVDTKVRLGNGPATAQPRILGFDAAGVVQAVGPDCSLFRPGDEVYYAGDYRRAGSNSEWQLVDERIVGRKPAGWSWADAAAMPLTLITAWEGLFEQLRVRRDGEDAGRSLLILAGAGGVGSIAIQLARLAGLTVIATASRPESSEQCRRYGAELIVDHNGDLPAQLRAAGHEAVDLIFCCTDPTAYFATAMQLLAPFGGLCTIVAPRAPMDLGLLRNKALRYSHEFMFARSMYQTPDMIQQHHLLNAAAELFAAGKLVSTRSTTLGPINAANLRSAHAQVETSHTLGKLTLEGW